MALNMATYIAIGWIWFAISFILVVTRLAVRHWQNQWQYWISEVFMLLSLTILGILNSGDTVAYASGMAGYYIDTDQTFEKWKYADIILFDSGSFMARFSLLAFYFEIFPKADLLLRRGLVAVIAWNLCCFTTVVFMDIFWCGLPLDQNWSLDTTACATTDAPQAFVAAWALNTTSELLVFALPFPLLSRLPGLDQRAKVALTCILLMGLTTLAVSFTRLFLGLYTWLGLDFYILFKCEFSTGLIVVCLPALRPLFRRASSVRSGARTGHELSEVSHNVIHGQSTETMTRPGFKKDIPASYKGKTSTSKD